MNTAIILQPFGLGDCIFAQGIANMYIRQGLKVYWPVEAQYLEDLKRAYPNIHWVLENLSSLSDAQQTDILNAKVVPIRWSDTFTGMSYKQVMKAKYIMMGMFWENWKHDAKFARYPNHEWDLIQCLNLPERFNLLSENFTGKFKRSAIPPINNALPNVYITKIGNYSLFDWASVMELATEIHFVASSNIYMLELLKLKAEKICIYKRLPDQPSHEYYDYILRSHKYILK